MWSRNKLHCADINKCVWTKMGAPTLLDCNKLDRYIEDRSWDSTILFHHLLGLMASSWDREEARLLEHKNVLVGLADIARKAAEIGIWARN